MIKVPWPFGPPVAEVKREEEGIRLRNNMLHLVHSRLHFAKSRGVLEVFENHYKRLRE